ncbi:3-isopropylmalate dehydratase large subunit [Entomomonas moraniae]|uniref:3-isopropylmalate dehydratase large subunit n=1 Tax=Entomomonas moraniae TaxID=2213226 RepID=A0A3Q9JK92_9GAMM|nr:3-isopropylmalate dehydratase large subunit [Entomomonas moraniae]AZS49726.1 3-isopropylmalate dehydratase large subunit [Entomomonas moraniae]
MKPKTLYEKLIDSHTIRHLDDEGNVLLYIDRTILNEYTSPQAFTGLRQASRQVWSPKAALLNVDHVNPTRPLRNAEMTDAGGQLQVNYFRENSRDFNIELFDVTDKRQGIEHVVFHEQGMCLPGMVIAAGDSHTTTYGAFGAFGFGIGTSEIEHLLATQTLVYKKLKTMRANLTGTLGHGVTAKDVIIAFIAKISASGATGYAIEFTGEVVDALNMEGRMTICNMAVEAGARGAFMAPDAKVYDYIRSGVKTPKGALWDQAMLAWQQLYSDSDAVFDAEITLDCTSLTPMVTWGISPDQAVMINDKTPNLEATKDEAAYRDIQKALEYMGLESNTKITDIKISHAFIGSCTNARIEDLRSAATILQGHKIANHVKAMVVPGSTQVREQAEREGIAQIFIEAGFEWRQSGCSMCLAMNEDVLEAGDRCASSTNRNFIGRQGAGARTHLMSPEMVAAAAIKGYLTDVREFM